MSGGIAYVLDEDGTFANHVNLEMVELEPFDDPVDQGFVHGAVRKHVEYTGSSRGQYVLENWDELLPKIVKVMPIDYKRALAEMKKEHAVKAQAGAQLQGATNG